MKFVISKNPQGKIRHLPVKRAGIGKTAAYHNFIYGKIHVRKESIGQCFSVRFGGNLAVIYG